MFRAQLIVVISLMSGFLLTIQLMTLRTLVRQVTPEASHTWTLFYAVSNFAKDNNIPLIIIDSRLLKSIDTSLNKEDIPDRPREPNGMWPGGVQPSPAQTDEYCQILCADDRLTHLATLREHATTQQLRRFIQSLRERDYLVIEFFDMDPTLLLYNINNSVPLHLLILNEKLDATEAHVIHISIFYERIGGDYWWQGHMDLDEFHRRLLHRQGIRKTQFKITDHAAIFDKSPVSSVIVDGVVLGYPLQPQIFTSDKPQSSRFLECDTKRAKEFYDKYPRDESPEATDFRNRAFKVLKKASRLLDSLGVPFWLSSGTLLGFHRQCDFFPWGVDVDIGILAKDYDPRIMKMFSLNNLPLLHIFGKPEDSFELSFHDNYAIKLDIFFFYEDGNGTVWNGGTDIETGEKLRYNFPPFDLCWTEFLEMTVRVPCQTRAYIEANYGPNWRVPLREWNWKTSPPNVVSNGVWPRHEWSQVMQTFHIPLSPPVQEESRKEE